MSSSQSLNDDETNAFSLLNTKTYFVPENEDSSSSSFVDKIIPRGRGFGDEADGFELDSFTEAFDASTSKLSETLEHIDSALDWTNNPLRFVFATFTVCATITWFGYAGDNMHLHRQAGSLAHCGGLTREMTWTSGMICGKRIGGVVLLVYRLMCFVLCLMYCYYENVAWFLT